MDGDIGSLVPNFTDRIAAVSYGTPRMEIFNAPRLWYGARARMFDRHNSIRYSNYFGRRGSVAKVRIAQALMTPQRQRTLSWVLSVLTDCTRAASLATGDFGTSPIFVRLSGKALLAGTMSIGVSRPKPQWWFETLCFDPNSMISRCANAVWHKYFLERLAPMPTALVRVLPPAANFTRHCQGVSHAEWPKTTDFNYRPPSN